MKKRKEDPLSYPRQPDVSGTPELPFELTELTDEELMTLLAEFTAWHGYAAGQLAQADVEERLAQRDVDFVEASEMVRSKSKQITSRKADARSSDSYQAVLEDLDNIYARRKMLGVVADNLEASGAVVSRELTRRIGRAGNTERRTHKFTP